MIVNSKLKGIGFHPLPFFIFNLKFYIMAIFKLGAFVTAIVGSVGGTNFRRGANNAIVTNKSFGGSRSKLLQNKQLNNIGNIFKQFKNLDPELQTLWADEALNFTFPDKFGVQKNLTARQLYTKMNIQLLPVQESISDPSGMTSVVASITIQDAEVDIENQTFYFEVLNSSGTINIMISTETAIGVLNAPTFTRRETIATRTFTGNNFVDFGSEFFAKFPQFNYDYNARVYVDVINEFGFKGTTLFLNAVTLQ